MGDYTDARYRNNGISASHLDSNHSTPITAKTLDAAENTELLQFHNCDHGVLVAVASMLLSDPNVDFAAANETHPLQPTTDLMIRLKPNCDTTVDSVFNTAVAELAQKALREDEWTLIGVNGGPLIDECEMPDGSLVSACIVLHDTDYKWANAVRRTIISEIPVLAITKVSFRRNTSSTCDEIIAHRMGMMPIRFHNGQVPRPNQGGISFSLQMYVSKSTSHSITRVSSTKIEPTAPNLEIGFSNNKEDETSGFTLTKMAPGQCIDLVASVDVGTGTKHARFSAVSSVGFKKIDNDFHLEMEMVGQLRPSIVILSTMRILAQTLSGVRLAFGLRKSA